MSKAKLNLGFLNNSVYLNEELIWKFKSVAEHVRSHDNEPISNEKIGELMQENNLSEAGSRCKIFGVLIETDENNKYIIGETFDYFVQNRLTAKEFSLLYLAKQGIYLNGIYKRHLLAALYDISFNTTSETFQLFSRDNYVEDVINNAMRIVEPNANQEDIDYSRVDILRGALKTAGILSDNFTYTEDGAKILRLFKQKEDLVVTQYKESKVNRGWESYAASTDNGVFNIFHNDIKTVSIFLKNYPGIAALAISKYMQLQQIFYGAPGTGKSFTIDSITEESNSIRTTFHPDSDYSTFVGTYKPITVSQKKRKLSKDELIDELINLDKISGINRTCQLLGFLYWNSFEGMSVADKKDICIKAGHTKRGNPNDTSMDSEIDKGCAVGLGNYKLSSQDDKILYKFVPQAFTKAYIEAWKLYSPLATTSSHPSTSTSPTTTMSVDEDQSSEDTLDDVKELEKESKTETSVDGEIPDNKDTISYGSKNPFYLIIEEINRGNCAQIFGDLFQLLDRNNAGYSSYAIIPDTDITQFLEKELSMLDIQDVYSDTEKIIAKGEDIKKGIKLVLPPNLYILATMNTSDQSLFPMDSAFKRRWDWEYVPIEKPKKENGGYFDWTIRLKNEYEYECDWWEFIEALNQQIFDTTESEDKQLGYFFVKAKDGVIDADTFVNKVVFYLWNDVFKDENSDIFNYDEKVWADDDKNELNDNIIKLLNNKKNLSFSTFAKNRELLSHYFIDSILKKAEKEPMKKKE